ncbi:MAG: hypothetical protein E7504_05690 [Ruminococcus sp.]|nr:hypothetical protein [Ruminococcus sp.]
MNIQATANHERISTCPADCENTIIRTLLKLGIPANTKGFHYIKIALMYGVESPIALTSMSKIIYPAIANYYYSVSASSIERAIRYAIAQSTQRGDSELISQIFGYTDSLKYYNPTNREFLAVVSEYIREMHSNSSSVQHYVSA